MTALSIDQLSLGDSAENARTISESDVYTFGGVVGDLNYLHTNEVAASQSVFGRRVAHGMLTASLLSSVIAHQLPGNGTIFLAISVKFRKPVYLGDTVTARVEVKELRGEKNVAILGCECTNQEGEVVLTGEATVMPPRG